MSILLLAGPLLYLFGTLIGWGTHWALHQRWTGKLWESHLVHHRKYPRHNLQSKEYRYAGSDDSGFVFIPIVAGAIFAALGGLWALGVPKTSLIALLGEALVVGYLHDWVHQAFHLRGHWLGSYRWFQALQALHFTHHRDARVNLGILSFVWDKVMKTYTDKG